MVLVYLISFPVIYCLGLFLSPNNDEKDMDNQKYSLFAIMLSGVGLLGYLLPWLEVSAFGDFSAIELIQLNSAFGVPVYSLLVILICLFVSNGLRLFTKWPVSRGALRIDTLAGILASSLGLYLVFLLGNTSRSSEYIGAIASTYSIGWGLILASSVGVALLVRFFTLRW